MEENDKPTIEEVIKYTQRVFNSIIGKKGFSKTPQEQKDEMLQEAYSRVLAKYADFQTDRSWKSLVYSHARGAILDYVKQGDGFEESRWSLQKAEEVGDVHVGKLNQRIPLQNCEGEESDVDEVAGRFGAFSVLNEAVSIRWDLLAKLAFNDKELRVFAWYLRGHTYEQIGGALMCGPARVGQMVQRFVSRFDDPQYAHENALHFNQICYALGISEMLGFKQQDWSGGNIGGLEFRSIGKNLPEVDLDTLPVPPQQTTFMEAFKDAFEEPLENNFNIKGALSGCQEGIQ